VAWSKGKTAGLIDHVRQFVRVVFPVWKMAGQFFAGGFDSGYQAAGKITVLESVG